MSRNPRSGVTLIEILIAVSLLSMLSVGILMAMRIGFNTMEKTDAHLVQNRRVANARKIIENEIAGFVFTRADWRPKPELVQAVPFVQWESQSMRFVTAYSLQDAWRGRPQIVALQVIPGDHNAGVRLIVNETPYTGPAQAGESIVAIEQNPQTGIATTRFAPILPGAQSFLLADKLAYCRFSYMEPRPEPPLRLWRPDWEQNRLPLGVRIEMGPLANTPSELHVTTVTMPLNVNRDQGFYADAP
ncbi:MAG: prepilin-type N-terminal cleavage/methylation domain-containing protein [Acidobacteriota bacterium]